MIPHPKRIQAVLFDLDDTLLDWSGQTGHYLDFTRPHLDNIYNYLCENEHSIPDRERFYENYFNTLTEEWRIAKTTWSGVNFGCVLETFFNSLNLNSDQIDVYEIMQIYNMGPVPGVTLYADAQSVLESLRCKGYKIGLITNSMMPMWMRDKELRAYGIIDYFDIRLTSGDVGFMKPHPFIYQKALQLLTVEPQQTLFVGDRPANDIAGANAAGLISVLISPAHLERELKEVEPDHIIKSLSELLPILEKLELDGL